MSIDFITVPLTKVCGKTYLLNQVSEVNRPVVPGGSKSRKLPFFLHEVDRRVICDMPSIKVLRRGTLMPF